WEYPTLSLVSKQFRSLVVLPELYAKRSLLGCTQHCLYIVLYEGENNLYRWYILCRKANGNRSLVRIPSLPPLTSGESSVAVGSKIYVFGSGIAKTSAYCIDCRSHTVQPLPSMPVPISYTMAGIIKEKIYVMDYVEDCKNIIMLFNTKTHMPVRYCLVYDTAENIWRRDDMNMMRRPHVLLMTCYTTTLVSIKMTTIFFVVKYISTYDLKRRCWGVVKGLKKLFSKMRNLWCVHTANYGGKLALFYSKKDKNYRRGRDVESKREIWCVEISVERRHGGEIWGKVEWCGQVLVADRGVMNCLNVMV
ncbi:unnamed protein product, partial [Brassica oleracea]